MKKIQLNTAKLQLNKAKITTLMPNESAAVVGGQRPGGDSEICPSPPIKLSEGGGCPESNWCPAPGPTPPQRP